MAKQIPLDERIIFALDVDSKDEAERWLDRLDDRVRFYKVGLQLFLAGGFPDRHDLAARSQGDGRSEVFDIPGPWPWRFGN